MQHKNQTSMCAFALAILSTGADNMTSSSSQAFAGCLDVIKPPLLLCHLLQGCRGAQQSLELEAYSAGNYVRNLTSQMHNFIFECKYPAQRWGY